MQVVKEYPDNVFSWIDLATTDVDAAKTFYNGIFGWQFHDMPTGDSGAYSMAQIEEYNVAGMGELPPDMKEQGVPPHWSAYIKHDDVDAVAARVTAAGGTLILPPMDVMDAGRMIMASDPAGAIFGVWQPNQHIGAQLVNIPNTLSWNELQTRELDAAKDFYAAVFGWTYEVDQNGYVAAAADGRVQAGMMAIDESWGPLPNNWTNYVLVENVEAAAAKANELGGTIMVPPTAAGDIGKLAVFQDPQGAVISVIEYQGEASPPPGY